MQLLMEWFDHWYKIRRHNKQLCRQLKVPVVHDFISLVGLRLQPSGELKNLQIPLVLCFFCLPLVRSSQIPKTSRNTSLGEGDDGSRGGSLGSLNIISLFKMSSTFESAVL